MSSDSALPDEHPSLVAVNRTTILTYGTRSVALHIDSQQLQWKFIVAAVDRSLLGSDFIAMHSFLVDLQGWHFIQPITIRTLHLHLEQNPTGYVITLAPQSKSFDHVLMEFSAVTTPMFSTESVKHGVHHHITTLPPIGTLYTPVLITSHWKNCVW